MTKILRSLSAIFFICALGGIVMLLIFDTLNGLRLTDMHQRTGALSLILIGCSYISLQLSVRQRWDEMLKKVLLGVAFLFWGGEQFLPSSPWVTAMDTLVVIIFVVDLGLIIVDHLRRTPHETPQKPSF
jgi:hypothetical protein